MSFADDDDPGTLDSAFLHMPTLHPRPQRQRVNWRCCQVDGTLREPFEPPTKLGTSRLKHDRKVPPLPTRSLFLFPARLILALTCCTARCPAISTIFVVVVIVVVAAACRTTSPSFARSLNGCSSSSPSTIQSFIPPHRNPPGSQFLSTGSRQPLPVRIYLEDDPCDSGSRFQDHSNAESASTQRTHLFILARGVSEIVFILGDLVTSKFISSFGPSAGIPILNDIRHLTRWGGTKSEGHSELGMGNGEGGSDPASDEENQLILYDAPCSASSKVGREVSETYLALSAHLSQLLASAFIYTDRKEL
ncbi:hypothetical protein GALMADRAFT_145989 [Galerina marginata CBS 339.88]|uniref:Uncharacterized protein n=1 Tax=Galerina marginata (strain CBS 339.88) TaxID=685588 RepID=A0A067SQE4_GALM3|nr:hypothetical protein GALMADRAFT_145989 [Galerina marginata CBS 339.88]